MFTKSLLNSSKQRDSAAKSNMSESDDIMKLHPSEAKYGRPMLDHFLFNPSYRNLNHSSVPPVPPYCITPLSNSCSDIEP